MFTIGEFSKITGLTVKTLRFYHEEGLLTPTYIDEQTGYRYYGRDKIETARAIAALRRLEFSLEEIGEILKHDDQADLLQILERQRHAIGATVRRYRQVQRSLEHLIHQEREAQLTMQNAAFQVQEKQIPVQLIAAVRTRGPYSACGKSFGKIGRRFGRHLCGAPFLLIYDSEYKENDADYEACMPIRKGESVDGIEVRTLPGGRCLSLTHLGPYQDLGRSYAVLLQWVKDHGLDVEIPTREVYLKGPGMIFKGNPKKYLTEIQMLIKEPQR